jgi:hypothetical protein
MKYEVTENHRVKICASEGYNSVFDKITGSHLRWGTRPEDDPLMAPCPEILDIEIATACDGIGVPGESTAAPCRFCYKANKRAGEQMSLETFKKIFEKIPKGTQQIAFGIGNLYGHDDMWGIFAHARENGVIPNVTINGWELTDDVADRLAGVMGAVSVSRYKPKDVCYDAVKKLTDATLRQKVRIRRKK